MKISIYKLTSPSGKAYIGKSHNCDSRWKQHLIESKQTKSNRKLHRAIQKYGLDSFSAEILEECEDNDYANTRERYWIEFYDTYRRGYNMTKGGDGVDSETARELRNVFYQTDRGLEDRKRRSEKFKLDNPSKNCIGKPAWNRGLKAKDFLSIETRKIMSQKAKGHWTGKKRAEHSIRMKENWRTGIYADRPKQSRDVIERQAASRRGFKQSAKQKEAASKAKSKQYEITYADGRTELVHGLSKFSRSSGIPLPTLNHILFNKSPSEKWGIQSITTKE